MWSKLREFAVEFWKAIMSCCHDCSQEHYNEGYDAFYDNKDLSANPYVQGSMANADWEYGWNQACAQAEMNGLL